MAYYKQATGRKGEDIATEFLLSNNYKIIARNHRNRFGEIDIIAMPNDESVLVFLEVKTRSNDKYGHAYEAVNYTKQQKILKTSQMYMITNKFFDIQPRYDIIEVYLSKDGKINHIVNAFGGG